MKHAPFGLRLQPFGKLMASAPNAPPSKLMNATGAKGPGIFRHEDTAEAMIMIRSSYKARRWNIRSQVDLLTHSGYRFLR
ncbi:MAG: hypothetical protein QME60_05905 [Verrucomicrobiota bacterium]|nr:hypothetical protein [Verrucomicrobiota bacterium]